MNPGAKSNLPPEIELLAVEATDHDALLDAYALLRGALGDGNVEDMDSFRATLTPAADGAIVPRMLCAVLDGRVLGTILGAYLPEVNIGMVLYSAVAGPLRGRGLYTRLRMGLMEWLATVAAPNGPDYLVSEMDADTRLGRKYVRDWGAFVAQCDYEVPPTQGLAPRGLDLLIQPVSRRSPPTARELVSIIREVYERVYRLEDVEGSAIFQRVVQSVRPRVQEDSRTRSAARSLPAR